MNIFATDECPNKSARALDDRRLIKMILESAQLLATSIWERGGRATYKATHKNHPCAVWTRKNRANYRWVMDHMAHLNAEYGRRFNKWHKCMDHFAEYYSGQLLMPPADTHDPHPNCTTFKDEPDTHEAYRKYLREKWASDKRPPKWTNSRPPEWR